MIGIKAKVIAMQEEQDISDGCCFSSTYQRRRHYSLNLI
jgi:hypothetical protein